jgi:ribosome-associated protein
VLVTWKVRFSPLPWTAVVGETETSARAGVATSAPITAATAGTPARRARWKSLTTGSSYRAPERFNAADIFSGLVRDDGGMRDVAIDGDMIRLGQFLKLADLIDTGGEGKIVIASGDVTVNGEVDTRRGRQLHPGDVVEIFGRRARVVAG